ILLLYVSSSKMLRTHLPLHSFPTRRSSDLNRSRLLVHRSHFPHRSSIAENSAAAILDGGHRSRRRFSSQRIQRRIARAAELLLRSEEHTSELQSRSDLVCRLLLEKKKQINK